MNWNEPYIRKNLSPQTAHKTLKQKIVDTMPDRMVLFFASPYVAGLSLDEGVKSALELMMHDLHSTIDLLGEEVHSEHDVEENIATYKTLIERIEKEFLEIERRPTVSFKPSALVINQGSLEELKIDPQQCYERIEELAKYAMQHDVKLSIDMEDNRWTDITLDIYERLLQNDITNVGTVLQSRLNRTHDDLKRFDRYNARFRMCIGIYPESKSIALVKPDQDTQIKERLEANVAHALSKGHYTEVATHDRARIKSIFENVIIPHNISTDLYEVQNLLGVPRFKLQDSLSHGKFMALHTPVTTRLYVPFARNVEQAIPYLRRRLMEIPHIFLYGITNMIGRTIDYFRKYGGRLKA